MTGEPEASEVGTTRRHFLGLDRLEGLKDRLQAHSASITQEQPPTLNPGLPRRDLIKHSAVLFGLSQLPTWLLTACLRKDPSMLRTATPAPTEPQEGDHTDARFGFNTHLMPAQGEDSQNPKTLDVERFKRSIDVMRSAGLDSLRFNLFDHYIQQGSATDKFSLNEEMMRQYDEAISYAHEQGMRITLATNVPEIYGGLPDEQYLKVAAEYFNTLGKRYAGKVNLWQIFNESDAHDFKQYNVRPHVTPEYAQRLSRVLSVARESVSTFDPNARFSVNVSGWPLSDQATFDRWKVLFDVVHPQIDVLSLNLFPISIHEADGLGFVCRYFNDAYGKPIQVGELGVSTGSTDFSEADQAEIIMHGIASLRRSPAKEVLIYEYSDQSHLSNQHEGNFGITDNPHIEDILSSMRPPTPASK